MYTLKLCLLWTCHKIRSTDGVKGKWMRHHKQSTVSIAPLSIKYPFPFPPSSAGVPRTVNCYVSNIKITK